MFSSEAELIKALNTSTDKDIQSIAKSQTLIDAVLENSSRIITLDGTVKENNAQTQALNKTIGLAMIEDKDSYQNATNKAEVASYFGSTNFVEGKTKEEEAKIRESLKGASTVNKKDLISEYLANSLGVDVKDLKIYETGGENFKYKVRGEDGKYSDAYSQSYESFISGLATQRVSTGKATDEEIAKVD
jgi:hypothetical protein